MDDVTWITEFNEDLPRGTVRLAGSDPIGVVAVIGAICSDAYLDGFTSLSTGELAARTGVRTELVDQVVDDLIGLGLVDFRANGAGRRLLEPSPSLRRMFRLLV